MEWTLCKSSLIHSALSGMSAEIGLSMDYSEGSRDGGRRPGQTTNRSQTPARQHPSEALPNLALARTLTLR